MNKAQNLLNEFLIKNQNEIQLNIDYDRINSRILSNDDYGISEGAQLINDGQLVAFPTETVYGLGADALNKEAVLKIYDAKSRPLTDPVIAHVCSIEQAKQILDIDDQTERVFQFMAKNFWPGPLTMVMKADDSKIAPCITANTGFVGVRWPENLIAQQLIKMAKTPIVAPSANLFSHVSPTKSIHVFNDLYDKNISIIDGYSCQHGIESTVIKVTPSKLYILRNGSVSEKQVREVLSQTSEFQNLELIPLQKEQSKDLEVNQSAPGQLLKHYSPLQDAYLLDFCGNDYVNEIVEFELSQTVLIDFGGLFENHLKDEVLSYQNISIQNDFKEAMHVLYDKLRWAENVQGCKQIFIANCSAFFQNENQNSLPLFFETVYDKTFRSCEGKKLLLNSQKQFLKSN